MEITRSKAIIAVSLLLIMAFTMSSVHAASIKLSSSPSMFVINETSPTLVQNYLLVGSNISGNVSVASSSNIFVSSKLFSIKSGLLYNLTFTANATKTEKSYINLTENSTMISVPVNIYLTNSTSTKSENYSIDVQGNIAPYSQVVLSVLNTNGQLINSGELEVTYGNTSQSFSLSSNPLPTISFGNIYGFVIIKYYNSQGYLEAHSIYSTGISSSPLQDVAISCPSLSPSSVNNITEYTINPRSTLNCILYNPSSFSLVTGVPMVAEQNGVVYFPNPADLSAGELSFTPPPSGWAQGPLILLLKSSSYKLMPTLFDVVPSANPSVLEFLNGSRITGSSLDVLSLKVVPNANLTIQITYPNGTVSVINSSSPLTFSSQPGNIKIKTYSADYTEKTFSLSLTQIPLTIEANVTNNSIYPYTTYKFLTYSSGSLYPFNGEIMVGSNILTFSNGEANGYLTTTNSTTSVVDDTAYSVALKQTILVLPISIVFLNDGIPTDTFHAGQMYEIEILDGRSIVPASFNITATGADNLSIPVSGGQAFFSFNKTGIIKMVANDPTISFPARTISVGPALIFGINLQTVTGMVVVILIAAVVIFLFFKKKGGNDFIKTAGIPTQLT